MSTTTIGTIIGILVSVVGIGAALWKIGRALWHAGASASELLTAVRDNTEATAELSNEFRFSSAEVRAALSDHSARITRLEQRRRLRGG